MYVGVGGYMVKRSHKSAATPVADKTAPQIFTYLCSALARSSTAKSVGRRGLSPVSEWYKGRMVLGGSGKVSFGRRIRAGP